MISFHLDIINCLHGDSMSMYTAEKKQKWRKSIAHNKSRECGGLGGTALISGSFEVLIGEQPQKAELISNLEL